MTAGWVAATIRGGALLRSSAGRDRSRSIAAADSWSDARALLQRAVSGRGLSDDAARTAAQTAASSNAVWQLRVLAGWVPPTETALVRVAAGPIEISNIERHLAWVTGAGPRPDPVPLGSLAVAWPRVATATSADGVRRVLRLSVWGDPGGAAPTDVAIGLRVAWLRRVLRADPTTQPWVRGALAVLIARERFAFDREIAPVTIRLLERVFPRPVLVAESLGGLTARLPPDARWPLAEVDGSDDLWRAETAVLERVARDAAQRVSGGRASRQTVTSILALLLVDLWRIHAAIELAGRGELGGEVFDAIAV